MPKRTGAAVAQPRRLDLTKVGVQAAGRWQARGREGKARLRVGDKGEEEDGPEGKRHPICCDDRAPAVPKADAAAAAGSGSAVPRGGPAQIP